MESIGAQQRLSQTVKSGPVRYGKCEVYVLGGPCGFYAMGMKKEQVPGHGSDQEHIRFRKRGSNGGYEIR